jgi:anti-anti-sigma regulatory factor
VPLIADMTATMYCDTAGALALLHAHYQASAAGTGLHVAIVPGHVPRVLTILGLYELLSLLPCRCQARHGTSQ